MSVPLAVAPSVKSTGVFLVVDLLAGVASPGSATRRALIIADSSAAGTITPDAEVVDSVAGADAVATFLGAGVCGHLASKALFAESPLAAVDLVAPAEAAGVKATQTVTFASGPPTKSWTLNLYVCGRLVQIVWAAGDTDTEGAAKLVSKIGELTNDLPVTAANVAGVVTLTAKTAGTWGNDIRLRRELLDGTTGTVTPGGTKMTGGTTEFNITTALTLIAGREYDLIVLCGSNTDAESGISTSEVGKLKAYVDANDEGGQALLQQIVYGANDTLAGIKAGVDNVNFGPAQVVFANNAESLPCEWAGAEAGARLREESIDAAANRIKLNYRATLYGGAVPANDVLEPVEVEDALNNGVTPVVYDATGNPRPERPITTYHVSSAGNPDYRLLDTSRVTGTYAVAKDLRVNLPIEFQGAKLSEDLPPGVSVPINTVEVKEVRAFVDGRVRFWANTLGVVKLNEWNEAVEGGTFVVRVNPVDSSQCDLVVPLEVVPPLAKFSLYVQQVGS